MISTKFWNGKNLKIIIKNAFVTFHQNRTNAFFLFKIVLFICSRFIINFHR